MIATEAKGGRQLLLTGNEVIEQMTCPTCWAAGYRAVLYMEPAQPRPEKAFCPICGVERRRAATRA